MVDSSVRKQQEQLYFVELKWSLCFYIPVVSQRDMPHLTAAYPHVSYGNAAQERAGGLGIVVELGSSQGNRLTPLYIAKKR